MQSKKAILILGAEGFVGKKLSNLLVQHEYDVFGIDIKPQESGVKYRNYIQKNSANITLDDLSLLHSYDCYGLINVGGVSRNGVAKNHPVDSAEGTITAFITLLELLTLNPPSWMLLTSTREVNMLLDEKVLKGKEQLYASFKLASELVAESYHQEWGVPLHIFRLSDIFGIGDHSSKVMQIFLSKARANEDINVMAPEAQLYLTEVNEVVDTLYKGIQKLDVKHPEVVKKCTLVWDDSYKLTLQELAFLTLEMNPKSTSKIISTSVARPRKVSSKLSEAHIKVIRSINEKFESSDE